MTDAKTLGEDFFARRNDPNKPDKHTLAWLERRHNDQLLEIQGATRLLNIMSATQRDCWNQIEKLREEKLKLSAEVNEANALLGELRAEQVMLIERVQRIADWVNSQRVKNEQVKP